MAFYYVTNRTLGYQNKVLGRECQIKEILAVNFVDYKGCCEKKELIEKTKRLYTSYEENKRLEKEIAETDVKVKANIKIGESDLCKICMETLIDCVLIECGHMVSCTKCGKRLAECPVCKFLFYLLRLILLKKQQHF